MSTYIGWNYAGEVQFFNEITGETTSHRIIEVGEYLDKFDEGLDELLKIVNVHEVKQLVFVNDSCGIKYCKSVVEKLTKRGFKSVYIQHWISNKFQTFFVETKC